MNLISTLDVLIVSRQDTVQGSSTGGKPGGRQRRKKFDTEIYLRVCGKFTALENVIENY
jgi:hypothetical protein